MDRRAFTENLLTTVASYALFDALFAFNVFTPSIKPITKHWAIQLNEYCTDLDKQTITAVEWQDHLQRLFSEIELSEILKFIDFEALRKGFQYPDLGVQTKPVKFPKLDGLPERTVFVKKIFGMKKDRAIIPHGHSNMASMHLVLNGEMHLRQYEKIKQEDGNLIIKPSIDKVVKPGEGSSVSDDKGNVHWFVANTDTAFTFDVIMLDLKGEKYDIYNIDILEKEDLADGTMRVPVLTVEKALKKYGKESHH